MQINYCDWFAWCMVTAVALLLLLNDKCKPESLLRDGRPGWRFPQTAGCKARTCFVELWKHLHTEAGHGLRTTSVSHMQQEHHHWQPRQSGSRSKPRKFTRIRPTEPLWRLALAIRRIESRNRMVCEATLTLAPRFRVSCFVVAV